jgi:flagellar motor switch protein FliN/FliY
MSTEAELDGSTTAPQGRPETLADALGEDGPGIAAEIESELAGGDVSIPAEALPPEMAERLGLLSDLEVTVTARLCATSRPLSSVLAMNPGSVLDLGRATDAPIELLANGVLVAYGEVVAVGNSLGVRVTKLARR